MNSKMKHLSAALIALISVLVIISCSSATAGNKNETRAEAKEKKVLYVTHEPGKYHKYTPQLAEFKKIAEEAKWKLTVITGTMEELIENLKKPDFAKGYDAIVYNFCLAHCADLEACENTIAQTRDNGVPAMLIHCSMHSFWNTYKPGKKKKDKETGKITPAQSTVDMGYKGNAKANEAAVRQWEKENPDKSFPIWGDFTGIASTSHGKHAPVNIEVIKKDHPAVKGIAEKFIFSGKTELYNNFYVTDKVVSIAKGEQGGNEYVVLWTCPQGKSQVLGFTMGHAMPDWQTEEFKKIMINSVNYLIENPQP